MFQELIDISIFDFVLLLSSVIIYIFFVLLKFHKNVRFELF